MFNLRRIVLIFLLPAAQTLAQGMHPGLADCRQILDERTRLSCYDRIAEGVLTDTAPRQPEAPSRQVNATSASNNGQHAEHPSQLERSALSEHWELDPLTKRGVFAFRQHRPNYFIATYNSSPNAGPYQQFRALAPDSEGLSHGELAYQLGFNLKLAEEVANRPIDLWFAYTQRSFWQASNQKASSPFRETDYQPEIMAVLPVDFHVLGLHGRLLNFGVAHQSNGQASTLSRSWNRVYLQVGLERGNFNILGRVWKRINEPASEDDNPDITDYMGRGDLTGMYRLHGHELSFLTRYNFQTQKGALQLGWAFPLRSQLKGYVHLFSGYGNTLIDYNAYQRVLGLGVQVGF
jgi:phospholipase A1/A2